jgi:polysaccharide pyruvyl transferase WcaK-like protein
MAEHSKERILLPRVIYGNRGDLLSRWGLLNGLRAIGQEAVHVFAHRSADLPEHLRMNYDPYGKLHNVLLSPGAKRALRTADRILWGGGLDMTDESSMAKLMYLLATFSHYRMLGKEIDCVFQGAGPLLTRTGKLIARQILQRVSKFIVRDEYTYDLLSELNPDPAYFMARDAIFFPGFEQAMLARPRSQVVEGYCGKAETPLIAINIRRWFHFSSDVIPFQLARKRYESRGLDKMQQLIEIYIDLVRKLRLDFNARILLVSAYNPGVYSWEDDMYWLQMVKSAFSTDEAVWVGDYPLDMMDYTVLMASVDLALSMRLHSSLTALRFGKPAVNISYAPKGVHAFHDLGLEGNAFDINSFMQDPSPVWSRITAILQGGKEQKEFISRKVSESIDMNMKALRALFEGK